MADWYSDYSLLYFQAGLLPLAYVLALCFFGTVLESVTLRFWGVLFLWIGYHLSPLLAACGLPWHSALLVDGYIDTGLLFSTLCMFAYLAGYELMQRLLPELRRGKLTMPPLPHVPLWLLGAAMAVCVTLFVVEVGGLSEVWEATRSRGEHQWDERDTAGKILRMVTVLGTFARIALASLASLVAMDDRRSLLARLGWGGVGLCVAALVEWHGFSRGAGFPFILLGILALYYQGRRGIPLALAGCLLTAFLGHVGHTQREHYYPGLGNYFEALTNPFRPDAVSDNAWSAESNPLCAMDAWTLKAEAADYEHPPVGVTAYRFFWNLNPFPSEIVPLQPMGQSLEEIMGTVEIVGITTPALAELYYAFGQSGALFMFALGGLLAWFDRLRLSRPGLLTSLCFLLCTIAFPLGLHSSVRVMTRPILYALVLVAVDYVVSRRARPVLAAAPLTEPAPV